MIFTNHESARIVIESIDGSGKTTTGLAAAQLLSQQYPKKRIKVADSGGVSSFVGGEQVGHWLPWLEKLEPHNGSKIKKMGQLAVFTELRRASEAIASHSADLVIGIRDPYRIDPAAYSVIFGPKRMRSMSALSRLTLFDKFTTAPDPDMMVHLEAEYTQVSSNIEARGSHDDHESLGKMLIIAAELPKVMGEYSVLKNVPIENVTALTPRTVEEVATLVEPLIGRGMSQIFIPADTPKAA